MRQELDRLKLGKCASPYSPYLLANTSNRLRICSTISPEPVIRLPNPGSLGLT
jgi:hypothetical protein